MKRALPEIDITRCTGCGDCVAWCPAGAVLLVEGEIAAVNPEDCHYCTDCETICPAGAISCPFEITLATTNPESEE